MDRVDVVPVMRALLDQRWDPDRAVRRVRTGPSSTLLATVVRQVWEARLPSSTTGSVRAATLAMAAWFHLDGGTDVALQAALVRELVLPWLAPAGVAGRPTATEVALSVLAAALASDATAGALVEEVGIVALLEPLGRVWDALDASGALHAPAVTAQPLGDSVRQLVDRLAALGRSRAHPASAAPATQPLLLDLGRSWRRVLALQRCADAWTRGTAPTPTLLPAELLDLRPGPEAAAPEAASRPSTARLHALHTAALAWWHLAAEDADAAAHLLWYAGWGRAAVPVPALALLRAVLVQALATATSAARAPLTATELGGALTGLAAARSCARLWRRLALVADGGSITAVWTTATALAALAVDAAASPAGAPGAVVLAAAAKVRTRWQGSSGPSPCVAHSRARLGRGHPMGAEPPQEPRGRARGGHDRRLPGRGDVACASRQRGRSTAGAAGGRHL